MRTTVLCGMLIGGGATVFAQFTVQKYYQAAGTATLNIEELSTGNLFTGIAYQSGISLLDPYGNFLHTHCYDLIPFTVLQSVRKHTDNEFYFVGGVIDDSCAVAASLEVNPVIGKMDSLGNIQSLHHYQLNAVTCSNTAADLVITNDAGAVAWGRDDSFFALRVDQDGQPLWSKQFGHNGSFTFIKELPGGDLLAGFNMDTAGASVARLDANGNFIWCKSYLRPMGRVHDALIGSDSSFVIIGYAGSSPQKLFMMKLDGAGEVQWCRGYDNGIDAWAYEYPSHIVRTQDGAQVILATLGQTQFPYFYRPFLMKTDENGDTLWTRSVGATGYIYYTASLMASADGGFYYDGIAWGDFGSGSGATFLFKADSLGHLPCHEHTQPVAVIDLFPTDSSFALTAVEGAAALTGSNSDAIYDAIVVYDGCSLAANLTTTLSHTPPVKIHPNPTTGRLIIEFNDPLMADNYYSIYDTMGRLLYQRPLSQGQLIEEVDLSRVGKGTYVIKFTSPEGPCYERVVVE